MTNFYILYKETLILLRVSYGKILHATQEVPVFLTVVQKLQNIWGQFA